MTVFEFYPIPDFKKLKSCFPGDIIVEEDYEEAKRIYEGIDTSDTSLLMAFWEEYKNEYGRIPDEKESREYYPIFLAKLAIDRVKKFNEGAIL